MRLSPAAAMIDVMRHRGPDANGIWLDPQAGVALGHVRLSILDFLLTGAQPMMSAYGRDVIVFNGKIYTFQDLHASLLAEGVHFRGTSDTEVLLEGVARLGLPATLQRADGMFALVV